jgi:predicted protein tyrosine phosphatase
MLNMNRIGVIRNSYQGKYTRVLCVCSGGVLRSPTMAWILSQEPYNYNTRACGISKEYALIHIDEALVLWADEIVCANHDHYAYVTSEKRFEYGLRNKLVLDLGIPDTYAYRDPELVELIRERYQPC